MRLRRLNWLLQFFHFLFLQHMRAIWQWNESKENEKGKGRAKREREIDKSCKVPFVMMSYSIYRDQFRDLSVVSEFTVPREIGTFKEKCNVYSHTTSIFQDFSTKSPVTFGFSARQVIDFPWSSTPGSNSTVLTVRFSDLSSCESSRKFSEIIFLSITPIYSCGKSRRDA